MLVVIAEKEELKLVEKLGYNGIPVIITGVGGLNVINALKNMSSDTEIINIGYAGSNKFKAGTVVGVSKASTYREKANFKEVEKCLCLNINDKINEVAPCYTSTDFVEKTNKEKACVFDMELAFICAMFDNVRSIKVVSDTLSFEEYKTNMKES
jgi:hypothetical protein